MRGRGGMELQPASLLARSWPGQAAGKIQHGRRAARGKGSSSAGGEQLGRNGANEEARQVQVEPALHRPLMELRRRADHGLAYLTFSWRELFPVSTSPWTSFFMTSGRAPVPVLLRRRRASALRHERPRYPAEEQAMQAAMERLASRAGDGFVGAGGGTRRGMARLADEASIDTGKPFSPPGEPLQHREEGDQIACVSADPAKSAREGPSTSAAAGRIFSTKVREALVISDARVPPWTLLIIATVVHLPPPCTTRAYAST